MITQYFLITALATVRKKTVNIPQHLYDDHFNRKTLPVLKKITIGEGDTAVVVYTVDREKAIALVKARNTFLERGDSIGAARNLSAK